MDNDGNWYISDARKLAEEIQTAIPTACVEIMDNGFRVEVAYNGRWTIACQAPIPVGYEDLPEGRPEIFKTVEQVKRSLGLA